MRAFIISGFMLAGLAAYGQNNYGDIIGTLIEPETSEPVLGATVVTTYGEAVYRTQTQEDGRFRMSGMPAGKYELMFILDADTLADHQMVEVSPDGIGDAGTITFIPTSSGASTEMTVYVLKYDKEQIHLKKGVAPEIRISGDELRSSALKFDPKTLLTAMTTDVRKDDNGELVFRGARAGDMICYIDGIKMNDVPNMPSAAFSYMMVYTGAIPAKYGDTNGGVVVIETLSYTDLYREWKAKMALAE